MTATLPLENRLLRYCRENVAAYESARLVDFSPISDGWETEVYAFTIAHDGGQDALILRMYPGEYAVPKSTREFKGMKTLYQLGYPVPEVLYHCDNADWLGKPFIIMQKIDGQPVGKVLDAASPEERQALTSRCVRLFVDLHALDWRPFVSIRPEFAQLEAPLAYIQSKLAEMEWYIATFGYTGFKPVLDWLAARQESVPCPRLSPLHQDFHSNNILMDSSGELYVIDWANIEVGDFRSDLAWTLLLSSTYGKPDMHDLILAEYERLSGKTVAQLAYFEVMMATRRLFSIAVSLGAGAQKLGMRAEAVELMKRQRDHIQQVYAILRRHSGLSVAEIEQLLERLEK
jgi:aminoglycoside phosphotransferase (APT) family kinase protein